ncbi:hypothetical protein [Robbsia sp. KACC 23696]|uniref:hypothetical protein n=1 Tax=Robbsia sp. KACC 23696 TaxID=3149231 RepID=UPI00325BD1C4
MIKWHVFPQLALMLIAALVYLFFAHYPTDSSSWASWVQAFFAPIAIGIAVGVPAWQQAQKRNDERLAKAEQVGIISEIVKAGLEAANELVDSYTNVINASEMVTFRVHLPRVKNLVSEFSKIHLHELPTKEVVKICIRARHHMENLYAEIESAEEARTRDGLLITEIPTDGLVTVIHHLKFDLKQFENEARTIKEWE